ncbi:phage protein NinX family protein [Citrobacter freundii]|uniref:phage protein NinX family protein n=1 Tax=Citrobacter freundii TaxID=546 RepID=UPI00070AD622|nr:phage protein NinX family protein [Citrobacter freundii]EJC8217986.1 DUF2591 family protein [Citrobacter freundii]
MDYSKLSDQEINKLVAFALGCKEVVPDIFMDDVRRYEFDKPKNKSGSKFYFDPCNNPADAWAIISDNRIAIIPDSAEGEWVAFNEFTLYEGDWMFASDPTHHSNGKNPLRCVMECFLMMQESANVQTDSAR